MLKVMGWFLSESMSVPARWWSRSSATTRRAANGGFPNTTAGAARISRAGSRYLRSALFMPALVATRHDPNIRAFYQKLVDRGKTKMQAIVAVMRMLSMLFTACCAPILTSWEKNSMSSLLTFEGVSNDARDKLPPT